MTKIIPHPFYPIDSILHGYVENDWKVGEIFGVFGGSLAALAATTFAIVRGILPELSVRDLAVVIWFVLSESGASSKTISTPSV